MLELSFVHWMIILSGAKYAILGAWLFVRYRRNAAEIIGGGSGHARNDS